MVDLQKPIPSYLNEKQNIIRLILFTSLIALFGFMALFFVAG
jgi:hypothetical protein